MRMLCGIVASLVLSYSARAQQPASAAVSSQQAMGAVATRNAKVTGGLEVQGDMARLLTNASVTAFDHTATVALARGGEALVCATSEFHLLHSGAGRALLFGLDRGAMEIHSPSEPQDVLLTPDIRFMIETPGTLDLRMRVTRGGDTCVVNAGAGAPVLLLQDAFSGVNYRLFPGQHVMFEKGDLHEVVDHERSPCGCPNSAPEAPATKVAAEHPFPAAVSEGLASAGLPSNEHGDGQVGAQVSTTLSYGPGSQTPAAVANPATTPVAPAAVSTEPPVTPPGAHDIGRAVGRFFHRLFHPGAPDAAK